MCEVSFYNYSDLPIQDISHEEYLFLSKINRNKFCEVDILPEEVELAKNLLEKHNSFNKYVFENFDFQIFYEECWAKRTQRGMKKQFTIYAKVEEGGVTRQVYRYLDQKTWYQSEKNFEELHQSMEPVLKSCWNFLKIKSIAHYNPCRSNIKMRNKSGLINLSLLPTLDPNFNL